MKPLPAPKGREVYLSVSPDASTDSQWIEEFRKDDTNALSALYFHYVRGLYNYGRQFAKHDLVQDCIQDVFFELIRRKDKLNDIRSIKAYLYASLRHLILKRIKQSGQVESLDNMQFSGEFAIEIAAYPDADSGISPYEIEKLNAACNRLPDRQREAILLFYYERLSYKDLTKVLGLGKITSARMLMHRAIGSLRKLLGQR